MNLLSQRNPAWSRHQLGWGPPGSTIGAYGCDLTCDSMIAWDSGLHYNPAQLDDIYTAKRLFVFDGVNDYDLLTDDALARAFPGYFKVATVAGYNAASISKAVGSKDTYVKLWISTASVKTHFVLAYSAGGLQIADPWTGAVGTLAGYGGPAAVHKMIFVQKLTPVAKPVVVVKPPVPVVQPPAPPVVQPPVVPPVADTHTPDPPSVPAGTAGAPVALPLPTSPPPFTPLQAVLDVLQVALIAIGRALKRG
jgi:hypothetical protein